MTTDTPFSEKIDRRSFIKRSVILGAATAAAIKLAGLDINVFSQNNRADFQDDWIATTCWIGKQDCGMYAHVVDGRIVKFEGHPDHPRNKGSLCVKGMAQVMAIYDPYRVKAPLKRMNAKGETGQWQEITWDQALDELASNINGLDDVRKLVWQKGRSKSTQFYDEAFVKASGATMLHHGAMGSAAGYRACEYTIGMHGVFHPDFRHCKYLLNWGWNIRNAGGNKTCWITWQRELVDARERGLKVVTLDPYCKNIGPHGDEWYPIKPGTDLMFFLALANRLIEKGYVDTDYLVNRTNAPFLVRNDGTFLRDGNGKELVWDTTSISARPFDETGISPALEGEFNHSGETVRTSYQVFKEHVGQYTPEVAAGVTDIPASDIIHIADELGESAMIGSTISLEGNNYPYRPVGLAAAHVTQQELGFQAVRAAIHVFMLLGAVYMPGGLRIDYKPTIHGNFADIENMAVAEPPYDFSLAGSRFFPINSTNTSLIAHVLQDTGKYQVNIVPEVMIIHMTNMLTSFPDQTKIRDFLDRMRYIAVIDPWMSETADHYADLVLPAATIEKYEGPLAANDQYEDAVSLRIPPITPLYKSRGEIDIYLDLAEKAGFLYGTGGYLDEINTVLQLPDTYRLDLNTKPTVEDIFDQWALANGFDQGIDYFKEHGISPPQPYPVDSLYPYQTGAPSDGDPHRLYGEGLARLAKEMTAAGAGLTYTRDYTALPTWRAPTMESSPSEYDLYLISTKLITFKQQRTTFIPLLNELEPEKVLEMNPETAHDRGLHDGDEVVIESHNAVANETREVTSKVRISECVRPDTVNLLHHFGNWSHPNNRGKGDSSNTLLFTGEGYVTNTADQSFHVKVRVRKV